MTDISKDKGSFRDPSGFIFSREGVLYRQVNLVYQQDYDHLMQSGLYQDLVESKKIISHEQADVTPYAEDLAYKIIQPTRLTFISYPYEWCFSQYKKAALVMLDIQKRALSYGMTLKDASAYNIQFQDNDPLLIDTLSFEIYKEGSPWDGYQQFCKHFLAPLLLMTYRDIRLNLLMRGFIDGIPLDIASKLLPTKTRLNISILMHLHLHAKAQVQYTGGELKENAARPSIKKEGVISLIESLERLIDKLYPDQKDTSWANYSSIHNYSDTSYEEKKALVSEFIELSDPRTVWDLGANTGDFSRIASTKGITTISFDIDHVAVEQGYLKSLQENDTHIHHAIIDLFNPSPSLGWNNQERMSLTERGPADVVLALALIHHLAIGNNVPFGLIVDFFAELTNWLIIEFVPKEDSQTKKLLASRRDIFEDYTLDQFEKEFMKKFSITKKVLIEGTVRTLYLMKKIKD